MRKRTRKRATIFILIVWFISILWAPAVIFWSYIAPQHSDIIKDHECDTAFRLNKTFKTLTALVNFYLPLLTMIVISCRIMVAIRLRSTMELGRRLSSTTQKQMKQDRTLTMTSVRNDNQTNYTIEDSQSLVTCHAYPCGDESADENPSVIEPGQCFCSTCQTCNGVENNNLWELQSPYKSSSSPPPSSSSFSFAQMKPISILFSSTKKSKEHDKSSVNTIDTPAKPSIIINSALKTNKLLRSKKSSLSSSFSDEFMEKDIKHSNPKRKLFSYVYKKTENSNRILFLSFS